MQCKVNNKLECVHTGKLSGEFHTTHSNKEGTRTISYAHSKFQQRLHSHTNS